MDDLEGKMRHFYPMKIQLQKVYLTPAASMVRGTASLMIPLQGNTSPFAAGEGNKHPEGVLVPRKKSGNVRTNTNYR
ncbi:MAG: hypothetical protein ACOYOO_05620 [Saprospiraceae bacterium]